MAKPKQCGDCKKTRVETETLLDLGYKNLCKTCGKKRVMFIPWGAK